MWDRNYDITKTAAYSSDKHTGIQKVFFRLLSNLKKILSCGFCAFLNRHKPNTGNTLYTPSVVWLLQSVNHKLTFLVPKKQGLLCWVRPLEGGVVIIFHTAGKVYCPTLCHCHILNQRVLTADTCAMTQERNM